MCGGGRGDDLDDLDRVTVICTGKGVGAVGEVGWVIVICTGKGVGAVGEVGWVTGKGVGAVSDVGCVTDLYREGGGGCG